MGTNYYLTGYKNDDEKDSAEFHIGKRSAAGLFCFDCGVTLCKGGVREVHHSSSGPRTYIELHKQLNSIQQLKEERKRDWHSTCPFCGQEKTKESISEGSAGIELGFNKNLTEIKTGVKSCSSFSFAMLGWKQRLSIFSGLHSDVSNWFVDRKMGKEDKFTEEVKHLTSDDRVIDDIPKPVEDEYGRTFTADEFLAIVGACPLIYTESIGQEFS